MVNGKGVIELDCQPLGSNVLNVKVGNNEPTILTQNERGKLQVAYDVTEPTYVYIYATTSIAGAPHRVSASENCVKLWSLKVMPGATGMTSIEHSPVAIDHYYTLDGRMLQKAPAEKGIYILNGRKVIIK